MTTFDTIYKNLIKKIIEEGIEELNERTGHKIKIIPGLTFQIDIEKEGFPILTLRKNPIKSPIAEQVWFITGDKDTEFLRKYTKMWDEFIEEDGTITSAYGYRWRHHFGRDQLDQLIKHLTEEPHSRQGVVITWDPSDDGLYGKGLKATYKKNAPCPFAFTVNIVGGRLHLHNIIRSNDMMLGCTFDTFGFSLLMCALAQKLGVRPGIYTHTISNAHIYDNHYEGALELIKRENNHPNIFPVFPENIYDRAFNKDETLVGEIYESFAPYYHPDEPIKGLDIIK
ncbi:MAG: thymidylate synthase [Candidatus Paceibacterota bacterium]